MTAKRIIISLHDVAPPFESEIREQLQALASIGIDRCALKVVPNWQGRHLLSEAPSLVDVLKEQHAAGSELILHGLEHRRRGALRGPLDLRLRATFFAGDAAEFLTLTADGVIPTVCMGRQVFEEAGLPAPTTFCAPGWLLAAEMIPDLKAAGIGRIIGMLSVTDLRTSRRSLVPALGYMGASSAQEAGVQLANRLLRPAALRSPVVKMYLHPQGGTQSHAFQWVLAETRGMIDDGWQPATFEEVFGRAGEV